MTFLTAEFPYDPPIGERQLISLNDVREVYGVRIVRLDHKKNAIGIEYDASRLKKSDLEFLLRNAGVQLRPPLDVAA